MGFFSGADDALQELLIEQERKKRQDMLDAIAVEDRKAKHANEKTGRDLQRAQIEESRAGREAAAAASRQGAADKFENSTAMGTELDDAGAGILDAAGRGSHVNRTAPSASLRVTSGLAAPTVGNPLGLDTSTAPGAKLVEGKRIFAGTAKQQEDKQQRDTRASYISSLPQGDERKFYEAQDAVGDKTPSAYVPPKPVKPTFHSVPGVGLVQIDPEGHSKILVASKEHAPKPGAPQIFYDKDSVPHAIRFTPDGGAEEVDLPAGITGKVPPKAAPKTPAQIEADAAARAKGAAAGKKEGAGGSGGLFDTLGSLWNAAHGKTAAIAPSPADVAADALIKKYSTKGGKP